jgi:hypothetical protein
MMKNFLFLFLMFGAFTLSAQKSNPQQLKRKIDKTIASLQQNNMNREARAAYLPDSIKLYEMDNGDSITFATIRLRYFPNGNLKQTDAFIDIAGFLTYYTRSIYFYSNSKKPTLPTYYDDYFSEDGIVYDQTSRDSFFYDGKDRVTLSKLTDPNDPTLVLGATTYIYKTNFNIPDTVRSLSINENTLQLDFAYEEFRTIDAKGNVTLLIEKEVDFATEKYDFSTKTAYFFDSQNKLIQEDREEWNIDDAKWEKSEQQNTTYNKKNLADYTITLSEWDEMEKVFLEKDSTFFVYNAAGKLVDSYYYYYDTDFGKYIPNYRIRFVYDKNDNVVREEEFEYDEDTEKFSLAYITKRWWSFYKDAIDVKNVFSDDYAINVANPMSATAEVSITSKQAGIFHLVVYDMNGQMVTKQFVGQGQNTTLSLSTAGHYILLLVDETGKPLAMKKVIRP